MILSKWKKYNRLVYLTAVWSSLYFVIMLCQNVCQLIHQALNLKTYRHSEDH